MYANVHRNGVEEPTQRENSKAHKLRIARVDVLHSPLAYFHLLLPRFLLEGREGEVVE